MTEEHLTFCRIGESLCGLKVMTSEGRVTEICPNGEHVATGGFACQKGLRQHQLYDSPDRLKAPRKRTSSGWVNASWDDALNRIGSQLK